MRRKQLGLTLLVLAISLLSLAPAAKAQFYFCDCWFCLTYPNSDCVDYSGLNPQVWNCAMYVFDTSHQCLPARAEAASPSANDLLARIFQPASAPTR